MLLSILLGGLMAAFVGILFGMPSLRIKGLYLAVATLAAQFFFDWVFIRVKWFTNYTSSGSVSRAGAELLRLRTSTRRSRSYLLCLVFVTVFALLAKNLVRGNIGRQWMAIRDMDIAAELMGIRPLYAKLTAFASRRSSSALPARCGLSSISAPGSRWPSTSTARSRSCSWSSSAGSARSWARSWAPPSSWCCRSLLDQVPHALGMPISVETVSLLVFIVTGALICWLLIVEPHGFARLWSTGKEKLRLWPYPY